MSHSPVSLTDRPGDARNGGASGPDADVLADLLETLRIDTLVNGRFELTAPWGIEFPGDDLAYLIVLGRGNALLEVDGLATPLSLSAGDTVLLPLGGRHRLRDAPGSPLTPLGSRECKQAQAGSPLRFGGGGPGTTLVVCAFRFRAAPRALSPQRLSPAIHLTAGFSSTPSALPAIIGQLLAETSSPQPGARVLVSRLADVLLIAAIRSYIASDECPAHGLRALQDAQIRQALGLIHHDPAQPWTVQRLASAVALSRSVFAARFNRLVGVAPATYLLNWRMTKAAELLRDDLLPISTVAARTGYQSEASFNRAFKRVNGSTPGSYRRSNRAPTQSRTNLSQAAS